MGAGFVYFAQPFQGRAQVLAAVCSNTGQLRGIELGQGGSVGVPRLLVLEAKSIAPGKESKTAASCAKELLMTASFPAR
jgi:hypothetical protein